MTEFDTYENPYRKEIVTRKFELKNGYVDVSTGAGMEIDEEVVKR